MSTCWRSPEAESDSGGNSLDLYGEFLFVVNILCRLTCHMSPVPCSIFGPSQCHTVRPTRFKLSKFSFD